MPSPSDNYQDDDVQSEAPPKVKSDDGAIQGVPTFVDLTPGTRWHATDITASTKKKGRR